MQAQDSSHETGVATNDKGGSALTRARQRKQNAVLQMKMSGAGWDDIADVLGFPTARAARVAYELALERELNEDPRSQAKMRDLAGKRLERLLRAVWAKAIDPNHPEHLTALTRAREIIAQHAKLFGLEAPTEINLNTPTRAELDQWVAAALSTRGPTLIEDDIFDGEIVEPEALEA